MKWAGVFLILLSFVVGEIQPSAAATEDLSLSAAINKAGRQRMLTQRIVKAYAQIGQNILPDESRRELSEAVGLFDRQLGELKTFTEGDKAAGHVAYLEALWMPFRKVAVSEVTPGGGRLLLDTNDDLLKAANSVVLALQSQAKTPVPRLVNISGRQRMLTQRLAKLYMLKQWGFNPQALTDEIQQAENEFTGALYALRVAPENTPQIERELEAVSLEWDWFRHALDWEGAESYWLVVVEASEAILDGMERITKLYEELSRGPGASAGRP